jgi:hypothetical protein
MPDDPSVPTDPRHCYRTNRYSIKQIVKNDQCADVPPLTGLFLSGPDGQNGLARNSMGGSVCAVVDADGCVYGRYL